MDRIHNLAAGPNKPIPGELPGPIEQMSDDEFFEMFDTHRQNTLQAMMRPESKLMTDEQKSAMLEELSAFATEQTALDPEA